MQVVQSIKRALPALLGLMLVTAALPAGLAGSAAASTTTQQTFTQHPQQVYVDTQNASGQLTIEVSSDDTTLGTTTLVRENGTFDRRYVGFDNSQTHQNITLKVTVHDPANDSVHFDSDTALISSQTMLAQAGGDTDLKCDGMESTYNLVNPLAPPIVDCMALPETTEAQAGADQTETKINVYQSGLNSHAATETYVNTVENRLNDGKSVARIKGKNAYIRALNNGSSKPAAKAAARSAVADYYTQQQLNLVASWNKTLSHYEYMRSVAKSEGIQNVVSGDTFINFGYSYEDPENTQPKSFLQPYHRSMGTTQFTLANGTSKRAKSINFGPYQDEWDNAQPGPNGNSNGYMGLLSEDYARGHWSDTRPTVWIETIDLNPPNENYNSAKTFDRERYKSAFNSISADNTEVQNEMDTLANNTYDAYQTGQLNNSDLVDPYVLASEYSPGSDYQGWAAATLTALGQNNPEAMEQIGRFNVTTDTADYTGILFSQENPASGSFEVNTTYNSANINGTQYVVTAQETYELQNNFTITDIETTDGVTRKNVTIVEKQYETTNVSELEALYDDLAQAQAQIQAREDNLSGGAGGGLLGGTSNTTLLGIAVAGGALLMLSNRDGGGNGGRY
jgi:hypothetical protein